MIAPEHWRSQMGLKREWVRRAEMPLHSLDAILTGSKTIGNSLEDLCIAGVLWRKQCAQRNGYFVHAVCRPGMMHPVH